MCAAAHVDGIHSSLRFSASMDAVQVAAANRRTHERLPLAARIRLKRVAGKPEIEIREYEGLDISCSGLRFRSERSFLSGTEMDLEVVLLDKQQDGSSVKMFTSATVIRSHPLESHGQNSVAVAFTDIAISRSKVR